MSDMEDKVDGVEAVNDDELDAVAGGLLGGWREPNLEHEQGQARRDGRTIQVPEDFASKLCSCGSQWVFARSASCVLNFRAYNDVFCYRCRRKAKLLK